MRVDEIYEAIRSSPRRNGLTTHLIAVDGRAGSGKSTLADGLGEILSAPIIHTDDFASWEDPFGWSARFLADVLEPIAGGKLVRFRGWDWVPRQPREWIEVPPSPRVIIEGVGSSRIDFVQYIDFSIWVETERSERLRRGIARDGKAMAAHWRRWMTAEEEYVAHEHPDERADLVVSGRSK